MINRNHLAIFHAVAEQGGFGRAARILHISQPAVSIQVSQLEETLGVRLFDRIGKTIRLTDAGHRLLAYAARISVLEREAAEAMQRISDVREGRLRLGASTTIGAYLLPQIISDFRKQWPDVRLEMVLHNSKQVQQQLLDGLIDIGLVEGVSSDPAIVSEPFRDDQLVPVAAKENPILQMARPNLKKFLTYPLILREEGSGTRDSILEFLHSKGFSPAEVHSFGSNEAVKGAVTAGLGVSFVSSLTIPGDVLLKRFSVVPLLDAKVIRRPFYVLRAPGRVPDPVTTAFLSILKRR